MAALKWRALVGSLRFGFGLALQQGVQHGQQEGRGLAAAGLARHHQVDEAGGAVGTAAGGHGARDHLLLHRGGLGEAQVFDRGDQLGRQAQLDEAVGQLRLGGGLDGVQGLELGHFGGNGKRLADHGGNSEIIGLHRRELALRFKSVGHGFNLKRERCRGRRPVGW